MVVGGLWSWSVRGCGRDPEENPTIGDIFSYDVSSLMKVLVSIAHTVPYVKMSSHSFSTGRTNGPYRRRLEDTCVKVLMKRDCMLAPLCSGQDPGCD